MYILCIYNREKEMRVLYATVQRWGNSHGVRIPKALLDALDIRENDRVELTERNGVIELRKVVGARHRTLEERLSAFYGKPVDKIGRLDESEVSWGKPKGREVW